MAKVGAQRAADLTGRSKSTIQRAMNTGKISYEVNANGNKVIDVSELERVFGLAPQSDETKVSASVEAELKRAAEMIEVERTKMRVKMLEEQVNSLETQLGDMRGQRDQWQKQAQQVLLTSQYSQKQAEELKEKLEERERQEEVRRKQMMEAKMKRMKGENENKVPGSAAGANTSAAGTVRTAAEEKQGAFQFLKRFKKAS